jgi:2'-5' RNA ligase
MNCGISIFPSKEVQDFANSYRKRFDPKYNMIQPHLTLREKQQWSASELASATARLERVTQNLSPFDIHFDRFSSYYPTNNVIYMALSDNEFMNDCYHAICSDELAEPRKDYHYHPHLTIGQQMGSDELHDVLASLRKVPIDLTSHVDRIHLLYQTENEAWTVYQTFLLRG